MQYFAKFLLRCAVPLAALAASVGLAPAQEEGNRYALVIGNNSYVVSPLQNAVNDARIIETALKNAGFRVTKVENSNLVALQSNVGEFLAKLGPSDTAFFFYAGHGVQIENENFLVPVDFEAASSVVAAKFKLFSVAQLFDGLKNRPKRSVVILDACRSNPVAQQNALSAGLAQPQNAPNESYVVFSTGPGQTAADNPNGRNSYFTEALAIEIEKPGQTIEEVVNHVGGTVSSETGGKQVPWKLSSLSSTFYFHPPANVEVASAASLAVKWMADAKHYEQREQWDDALASVDQIIQRKAGGSLQAAAEGRRGYLVARRDAQTAFDQGDYAAAAKLYEAALKLDPFSSAAAFGGANSYLLLEQIDPAVRLLQAVEVRGTTESAAKALRMITELKTVNQSAAQVASAPVPAPPPIEEVFGGARFGMPDWDGSRRVLASSPVDQSRFIHDLDAKAPPIAPPADPAQGTDAVNQLAASPPVAMSQLLKDIFHVEVLPSSETRNLAIKRASSGAASNGGTLQIEGADAQLPVIYEGQLQKLPAKLSLQPGKYEIRTMRDGKTVDTQEVEIAVGAQQTITIKK
jgi:hypothetical protein